MDCAPRAKGFGTLLDAWREADDFSKSTTITGKGFSTVCRVKAALEKQGENWIFDKKERSKGIGMQHEYTLASLSKLSSFSA